MSNLIYPNTFLGIKYPVKRTPKMNRGVQRALTGKRSTISYQPYPLYEWELAYEYLDDSSSRANYLTWSQDFTTWQPSGSSGGFQPTVVGNWIGVAAPDGTYTADRIIFNTAGVGSSSVFVNVLNGAAPINVPVTFSVWLRTNDGSTVTAELEIFGNVAPTILSVITVTPNWQRFSVSGIAFTTPLSFTNARQQVYIATAHVNTSDYVDVSVWGAQLEQGVYATGYIPTFGAPVVHSDLQALTGFFNRMVINADTFLFQDPAWNTVSRQQFANGDGSTTAFNLTVTYEADNSIVPPNGLAGAPEYVQNTLGAPIIFTERYGGPEQLSTGSRTNLALQSNFAASWTLTNATITTNAATAPDGTTTAASFSDGVATGQHIASQAQGSLITANGRTTFSVWLKANTLRYAAVLVDDNTGNGQFTIFDLLAGVISQLPQPIGAGAYSSDADAQMVAYPNGWYRCSISCQTPITTFRALVASSNVGASGTSVASYTGANNTFFMWGAQTEVGTQPTALIPVTTAHLTNGGSDYSLTGLTAVGDVNTFQQVQMVTAPAVNVPLTWSGTFLYRAEFIEDSMDFSEFMNDLWEQSSVKFQQVIL